MHKVIKVRWPDTTLTHKTYIQSRDYCVGISIDDHDQVRGVQWCRH